MTEKHNRKTLPPRPGQRGKGGKKTPLPSYKRGPFSWLIFAMIIFTVMMMLQQFQSVDEIRWDEFVSHVENKHIDSVTIKDGEVIGKFNEQGLSMRGEKGKDSFVVHFYPQIHGERLEKLLAENQV